MIKLIKTELSIFFHTKKTWILLLVGMCLFTTIAWGNNQKDQNYEEDQVQIFDGEAEYASTQSNTLALLMRGQKNDKMQQEIEYWWKYQDTCLDMKRYYSDPSIWNSKEFFQKRILHDQTMLEGIKAGYRMPIHDTMDKQIADLNERITLDTYMMEHDITPYHSPYAMNISNFFVHVFEGNTAIIIVFLLFILLYDLYSKEFQNGAFKMMFTLPYARKKLYLSKVFSSMLHTLIYLFLTLFPVCVILGILHGSGSLIYPVWVGKDSLIISGSYILQVLSLFIIYFLMIAVTILMISVFFPVSSTIFIGFGAIMVFVYCTYMLSQFHLAFTNFVPFFYCYGIDILQKQTMISYPIAIGIIVIISFVMMTFAYRHFVKQDFIQN